MRFAWIRYENASLSLGVLCRAPGILAATPAAAHARRDAELDVRIRARFA